MKCPDAKHVFVSLAVLGATSSPALADANNANQVAQAIGKQISTQFLNHDGDHRDGDHREHEHRDDNHRDNHHDEYHHDGQHFGNDGWNQQQAQHDNHERAEQWQRQQQQEAYQHQLHEAREHSGWGNGWYTPRNGGFGQFYNRPHLSYRFIFENDAEDWLDDNAYITLDRWALANFDYYHWGRLDTREYEQSRRYFWRLADLNEDGFVSNYEWRFFCDHYAHQQYGYR